MNNLVSARKHQKNQEKVLKLKVSKGELIISNNLEMVDDYLPGGVGAPLPPGLVRVKKALEYDSQLSFES